MFKKFLLLCTFAATTALLHAQAPVVNAKKRTATLNIDGNPTESIWEFTNNVTKTIIGTPNNTVTYAVLWDSLNLYVAVRVTDANRYNDSQNGWDDDATEIYIDADNNGGTAYGANDRQFVKEWNNSAIWEKTNKTTGVQHAWANTANGYTMELRIPWNNIGITNPQAGRIVGFDLANDDDDNGSGRESQRMWAGDGDNWQYPRNFGDLVLINTSDVQAPSTPANLVASGITQSSLTLTWSASTDNIGVTGYDVYRNGTKINTSLVTTTSYNVTGLSAATAYQFYVQARDAAGNSSANSNTVSVTTPDTQAPTVPQNLAASNRTQTSFTLSWIAATDNVGVTGYDIFQDNVKINATPLTATSFAVSGLVANTTYAFYVRAMDAAGNSANSSTLQVTTLPPPDTEAPTSPSGLVASGITASSATLTWVASSDNVAVAGYDVYQNGVKITASPVAATTYQVSGLAAATGYGFYVQARDAAGNVSTSSNTVSITTAAAPSCSGTGSINYQKWNNVTGTAVSNLTSNANYPNSPSVSGSLTSFEIASNTGDNYGIKVYGYICPPVTGSYTFWIAGDDNCELWLSTNSSASAKQRIAYHTLWTNAREWNKFTTQKSAAITLTAGQLYYVEALMKEGSGGDNMAVGWARPGQAVTAPAEVIPGSQLLASVPDTEAPSAPANLRVGNVMQTTISLSWMAATDNIGISGYDVYNSNNVKLNAATVAGTNYTVTGLTHSTAYTFYVKAKDATGNSSAGSNTVTATTIIPNPSVEAFTQRTVITNQRMPHDLVYGPDNNLWYIERFGGTVSFVNPATGAKTMVLSLGSNMVRGGGQDGLMGLALHPQFAQGKPYVYIAYTYQSSSATVRKTRIARYTYDSVAKLLMAPATILENIPGSNDHNSGRIAIGPDLKLYYTVGDMGSGQFDNRLRTQQAQNLDVLEGKILRLNTEIVNNSWIPADNPFVANGVISPVFSFGHRNPQGLVWGNVNGANILYSSEHGPYSDDELNIIEGGRNYGWPAVSGFCDGNYNGRYLGGVRVTNEQNSCVALNAKEPLRSLFPVATPPDSTTNNSGWPSTAPSGMDFYGGTAIPGWQNSVLVAQLKTGVISRFKLSSDGQYIISDTINYFRGKGRFRDVVVSADGLKIYVACDSSGSTSGPTGGVTSTPANPGSILEFTYQPSGNALRMMKQVTEESMVVVEEVTDNRQIDVYPNPARDYFIVYNYKQEPGWLIELVDISGKLVKKQTAANRATRIETNNLADGLYILRITDAQGKSIRVEKILVQK